MVLGFAPGRAAMMWSAAAKGTAAHNRPLLTRERSGPGLPLTGVPSVVPKNNGISELAEIWKSAGRPCADHAGHWRITRSGTVPTGFPNHRGATTKTPMTSLGVWVATPYSSPR